MATNEPTSKALFVAVLCLLSGCANARGQSPPVPLKVSDTIPVREVLKGGVIGFPKCDARGDIYAQLYVANLRFRSPIRKVSPDGHLLATFAMDVAPGEQFKEAHISNFAIGARGEVYFLIAHASEKGKPEEDASYILAFEDDGQFDSVIKLAGDIFPVKFAVFADGEFLVEGVRPRHPTQGSGSRPVLSIFDQRGQWARDVVVKGDTPTKKVGEGAQAHYDLDAFSLGDMVPGQDGNVYLMRREPSPPVLVISPAGVVERRITLIPPAESYGATSGLGIDGARILVRFSPRSGESQGSGTSERDIYSLFDAYSGERLMDFQAPDSGMGALACYTPDGLTFIESAAGLMALRRATLR